MRRSLPLLVCLVLLPGLLLFSTETIFNSTLPSLSWANQTQALTLLAVDRSGVVVPTVQYAMTTLHSLASVITTVEITAGEAKAKNPSIPPINPQQSSDAYVDDFDLDYVETLDSHVADPFEPWNRFWFFFNNKLYTTILKPIIKAYNFILPIQIRNGVRNAFHNLLFPVRFFSCLLQGNFKGSGIEIARFIGNTAFGALGLMDTFNHKTTIIPVDDEDFGQTLGTWGLSEGFYIIWPIIGPSSARDTLGMLGDYLVDPITYINPLILIKGNSFCCTSSTIKSYRIFNEISFSVEQYDDLSKRSVEPYTAMKNAYIQFRRNKIAK